MSILYIYPLSIENYGLSQAIGNFSLFLVPFIGFNANAVVINFYDQKKKDPNTILLLGFFLSAIFSVVFLILYFIVIKPNLSSLTLLGVNPSVFNDYSFYILLMSILMVFIGTLNNHSNNLRRAVIPNLLSNVGLKIFTPLLILGTYFGIIEKDQIPLGLLIFYLLVFILLGLYLWSLGGFPKTISLIDIQYFKNNAVLKYAVVSGFTGIASILATKIDIIAISGIKSLEDVGKYSLPYFMASLIEIPLGGIASISSPLISQYLKNDQHLELDTLLKKASNSLFLSGIFIFTVLYAIFPDLILISNKPQVFRDGLFIFIIIGIAKLIDMVTSLNTQTVSYSKYYSYNLYFVVITAISNLFFTLYFTKKYGIIGTSISILLSIIIFNLLKFLILKIKLNLNPFSKSTLIIIAIFAIEIILINNLNLTFAPLINIAVKGTIIFSLFLLLVRIFKPSDDVHELLFGKNGVLTNALNWKKIKENIGL
ncbi:MAG: polysaccharide biosynthesis C-terminal domain-containing protein [Bacteroidota bacterium]